MSAYPNMLVHGASQKGKTWWANRAVHERAGCFSVAFNTKRAPDQFAGPRADTLAQVAESWRRYRTWPAASQRVFYGHPVFYPDRDLDRAHLQLEVLVHHVLDQAETSDWRGDGVHVQVVVDEAHKLNGPALESVTRTGLGVGVRTVLIDQDLTGISKATRNNLDHWILFEPGRPDQHVFRSQYGHLYDVVLAWTSRRYHYVEDLHGEVRCWEPWPSRTWHPPGDLPPARTGIPGASRSSPPAEA